MCGGGERLERTKLAAKGLEMAGLRLSWVIHFFLEMSKVFPVLETTEFKAMLRCCCLETTGLCPCL